MSTDTDPRLAEDAASAFGAGRQPASYGSQAPGRLYSGEDDQASRLQWMLYEGRFETDKQRQRWKASRLMFRGQHNIQVHQSSGQLRATSFDNRTGGTRTNHMNRVRTFTEARSAILTAQKPKFSVLASRGENAEIDAAKQADRLVEGMWDEWGITDYRYDLSLNADQDGISFVSVMWDPSAGAISRRAVGPDGQEVTDPADVEALQMAGMLKYETVSEGDFVVRVVSPMALSIDPNLVKDWKKECNWVIESRLMPTHEVEKLAGMSVGELRDSDRLRRGLGPLSGSPSSSSRGPSYMVDDDDRGSRVVSDNEAVLTHWAYIKPHADWPRGGCILFLDQAPAAPLIERPWEDDLPYFPHVPRPDGGNILRAHGIVWDLMGLQHKINRSNWQLERWADLVGRPPMGVPIGSIRGGSIFSADGTFEYQPNIGMPSYMPVPAEPSNFMMNYIPWLVAQMAEIAIVSDPSRGVAPGKGVESEVALQGLVQANETQLSAPERSLTKATNWMVSRILKLIGQHYTEGRLVQMPGVDDVGEYTLFKGEMIGGAHQFRVKGSTLPKSREQMLNTLMGFAPVLGAEIRPFIKELIQGDVDKFLSHEDRQARHQRNENRMFAALAADEKVQQIWKDFETERDGWMQALQMAGQSLGPGHDPGDPAQALAEFGATEPKFTAMLVQANIEDVPQVTEDDGHPIHIMEIRDFMASDGYRKYPPLVKQLAVEHRTAHLEQMSGNLMGIAAQQPDPSGPGGPPPPNPRGEASQPKAPGAPSGGMAPMEV